MRFALLALLLACNSSETPAPAPPPAPAPEPAPAPPPAPRLPVALTMNLTRLEGAPDDNSYITPVEIRLQRGGLTLAPAGTPVTLSCSEEKGQHYVSLGGGGGGTWPILVCDVSVAKLKWKLRGPNGPSSLDAPVNEAALGAFAASPELVALPDLVALALGDKGRQPAVVAALPRLAHRSPVESIDALLDPASLGPGDRAAVALHKGDIAAAAAEGDAAVPFFFETVRESDGDSLRHGLAVLGSLAGPAHDADVIALVDKLAEHSDAGRARIFALAGRQSPEAKQALADLAAAAVSDGRDRKVTNPEPDVALLAATARALPAPSPRVPVSLTFSLKPRGKGPALVDVERELRVLLLAAGLDLASTAPPVATLDVRCKESPGPAFVMSRGFSESEKLRWTKIGCQLVVKDAAKKTLLSFSATPSPPPLFYGPIDEASARHFTRSSGLALLAQATALVSGGPTAPRWSPPIRSATRRSRARSRSQRSSLRTKPRCHPRPRPPGSSRRASMPRPPIWATPPCLRSGCSSTPAGRRRRPRAAGSAAPSASATS